jgi:hypothetical protein
MTDDARGRIGDATTSQPERENKWIERREDYALRFVPLGYRKWSWISLLGIMLGVSTAMFFLAWGGQLAQSYGTKNLLIGMKRSQTYKWNPVGVGSLIVALVPAIPMAFGLFGPLGQTLAPFVSGALAFVAAPVLAYLTKGRYYVSPTVAENVDTDLPRFGAGAETEVITASTEAPTEPCVKCGKHFELAEFVRCPFHEGAICSVCCAAEPDCGELCKQQAPDEPTPVKIEDRRR